jgi:2-phosphoglycerate kinase
MSSNDPILLFIGGAPRTGKTTLARRISQSRGYVHLPVDGVVHAFGKAYPQLQIDHLTGDDPAVIKRVAPFVYEQIFWHMKEKIPLIADGYHLGPKTLNELVPDVNWRAVFLCYPEISAESLLKKVRANEGPNEWTRKRTDTDLLPLFEDFIKTSIHIRRECEETDMPFIIVGDNLQIAANEAEKVLLGKKTT